MPNEIPLPGDLHNLIEKREQEERREAQRRMHNQEIDECEQRTGNERRKKNRRTES